MILLERNAATLALDADGDLIAENGSTRMIIFRGLSYTAILHLSVALFRAAARRKRGPALGQAIMAMRGLAE